MKFCLNQIVGSDSEATGPENGRPMAIIEPKELMVEIDDIARFGGFGYFAHLD